MTKLLVSVQAIRVVVIYSVAMVAVGPKPVAGDTDAVLWHEHPTRVILKRHNNSSLGLSIITRQVSGVLGVMGFCVYLSVCLSVYIYVCVCVCLFLQLISFNHVMKLKQM